MATVLLCASLLVAAPAIRAAYLENVPQRLVQPDGSVVPALATGDEFYHRLHDAAGFTIVQDPLTGWFVYAEKVDGELLPTVLRPGQDDPELAGLAPNLLRSREICMERDPVPALHPPPSRLGALGSVAAQAVTGTLANVVIFIRFSDQTEFGLPIEPWETVFNGAAPAASVKAFFEEASYGQMSFQSSLLPAPIGGLIVSYQDAHPRSYYSPYNAVTNPGGYRESPDRTTSRGYREVNLLKNAVLAVAAQVPPATVVDGNGDGYVDATTFVVRGGSDSWGELLWPHASGLYDSAALIAGTPVGKYSLVQWGGGPDVAPKYLTYCHELGHVVGFPDLYHYNMDGLDPVGIWDMMAMGATTFSAHTKARYVGWIASIPEITTSGSYTLNPLTSATGNAWKIASPNTSGEYFIVEYRRKTSAFERYLPSSGLLVYRINPELGGNGSGPPDEVYVYRPGGTLTAKGDLSSAALSADYGRVALDDSTDPPAFLSDGTQGRLRIYDVGPAGDTIKFKVEILPPCYSIARVASPADGGTVTVTGAENCPGGYTGGATVTATATPAKDATLLGWHASGGTIADPLASSTTFTISTGPQAHPTLSASFATPGGAETQLFLDSPRSDSTGAAGSLKYYWVVVPAGRDAFSVTLQGVAVSLYVSPGSRPTTTGYACRRDSRESNRACSFPSPSAGVWWIGVGASNAGASFTLTATVSTEGVLFVPVILDVRGVSASHYTSELTLTNRGDRDATLRLAYTGAGALGGGAATKEITLPARSQRIEADAIAFLSGSGTVPPTGNRGGTLSIRVSGVGSLSDVGATVRTTTAVPNGRAGLAYGATPAWKTLAGPSYICGLREDRTDRSNVALQNAGGAADGDVTLRMTLFSGDSPAKVVLPDVTLPPGGFAQVNGVLGANGMANGYVKVERVAGTAPYFAYGVVNDQVNSDGSFVPPQPATTAKVTGLTVPVVLEAGVYTSELVVTNWSDRRRELTLSFVSDQVDRPDRTASVALPLEAGAQRILPNVFQYFRDRSAPGVGSAANGYVGALFVTSSDGDLSGVVAGARTSAPGGGGRYGLFYPATPFGAASSEETWIFGLRQDGANRTNVAIVNTGEAGEDEDAFEVDVWDGATGRLVRTVTGIALKPRRWMQVNGALATWTPGVANGFVRVRRVSGTNPFVAYGVVNDGGAPQTRSDDGAFLAAAE